MKENRSESSILHFPLQHYLFSTRKFDNVNESPSVERVKVLTADNNPGTFKIMVGDWVAQWDSLYSSWFYYNSKTDFSTWDKPMELQHVSLNPPKGLNYIQSRLGND